MEAAIGSLLLTIAVVAFISIRFWGSKDTIRLDEDARTHAKPVASRHSPR